MDAQTVIDSYINDIAARLPRKLRNDVGVELRTLLTEQLTAAAAGRAPDEKLALEVVRRFGPPEEVASRYSPRGFQIIEPEHAPVFVKLSVACVAIQWAFTLPAVFTSRITFSAWWLGPGFGALAWVGALVVWFGLATWIRRNAPVDAANPWRPWALALAWLPGSGEWRPVDRRPYERQVARAELGAWPIGVALTIFFAAPAWFLGLFTPAGADTSWAQYGAYSAHFYHRLFPVLIALMVVRLGLCAAAGVNARLRDRLEVIRFGLWVCFVGLLYWGVFAWDIFAVPAVDALFKAWVMIYLFVNVIQMVLWVRHLVTRVRVPTSLS
jgi:hypothetical protein